MTHAHAEAVPTARTQHLIDAPPRTLFFAGAFVVTASLGAANGGYFPASWGWGALGLFWAAVAALALRGSVRMGRLELAFLAFVTALVGWIWLSIAWSSDPAASVLEGQRGLVLVGA